MGVGHKSLGFADTYTTVFFLADYYRLQCIVQMGRPIDQPGLNGMGWKLNFDIKVTSHPSVAKSKRILSLKDP